MHLTTNEKYEIIADEFDRKINNIFVKYIKELKNAYNPLVELSIDQQNLLISNYVSNLIFRDIDLKNKTKEYKVLLFFVMILVSSGNCNGFDKKHKEDLLDYTDIFGRLEQALNILVDLNLSYVGLLELYSKQIKKEKFYYV